MAGLIINLFGKKIIAKVNISFAIKTVVDKVVLETVVTNKIDKHEKTA